jgi:hypothetical protein
LGACRDGKRESQNPQETKQIGSRGPGVPEIPHSRSLQSAARHSGAEHARRADYSFYRLMNSVTVVTKRRVERHPGFGRENYTSNNCSRPALFVMTNVEP